MIKIVGLEVIESNRQLCYFNFLGNIARQDPATGYIPLLQSIDLLPVESQIPKGSLQEVDASQK